MTIKGEGFYNYLNQNTHSGLYIRDCYLIKALEDAKLNNKVVDIIFDGHYSDYFLNQFFDFDINEYKDNYRIMYEYTETYYQVMPYLEKGKVKTK